MSRKGDGKEKEGDGKHPSAASSTEASQIASRGAWWDVFAWGEPDEDGPLFRVREEALGEKGKAVYLIRHGQSEYNKWRKESFTRLRMRDMLTLDPGMRDVGLSAHGHEQAARLRSRLKPVWETMGVQSVLSSPLCRALQTAKGVFSGLPAPPCEAAPLLTERVETLGDWGSGSVEELERKVLEGKEGEGDWSLDSSGVSFDSSISPFWYTGDPEGILSSVGLRSVGVEPWECVDDRIARFCEILARRPERRVVIVGHSMWFKRWTGTPKMRNLEMRPFIFAPGPTCGPAENLNSDEGRDPSKAGGDSEVQVDACISNRWMLRVPTPSELDAM